MPAPTSFADLSTTAASNFPAGADNVFPSLDDTLRVHAACLASIMANTGNGWTSPYATAASPTFTGTMTTSGGISTTTAFRVGYNIATESVTIAGATTARYGLSIGTYTGMGNPGLGLHGYYGVSIGTSDLERIRIDSSGNSIVYVTGTAPTLGTNSTMSFELTSNTSLKIVARGSDGVTRSVSMTLA